MYHKGSKRRKKYLRSWKEILTNEVETIIRHREEMADAGQLGVP